MILYVFQILKVFIYFFTLNKKNRGKHILFRPFLLKQENKKYVCIYMLN